MQKLTDSFYRYLWLTCESVLSKNIHVKEYSHLSCLRGPQKNPLLALTQAEPQRQFANKSNKFKHIKKLGPYSNEKNNKKPMGDSFQPTLNHASYGGQFEISDSNDAVCSSDQWRKDSTPPSKGRQQQQPVPPNFRTWEPVRRRGGDYSGPSIKFKIVSYNVLAQYLLECHPYLYTDCQPHDLKWKVRSERLYQEIMQLAPDILCLQEVQASHLSTFYQRFERNGYMGIYKQKTGQRHDGCAIYFKKSLFRLLDQVTVEFYQPELPILNRDNIGIMAKLTPTAPHASPFVVATTHLLYNPKRTDVRLAQMQVFLAEIDRFAYFNNGKESGHLPIIITGDLNSKVDSAVVQLMEGGQVSAGQFRDNSDWKRIEVTDNCQHLCVYLSRGRGDGVTEFRKTKICNTDYRSNPEETQRRPEVNNEHSELFNTGVVGHSLNLTSVYDKFKPNGDNEATTFQDYWLTVDYIYFSRLSRLSLVERLRLPTAGECSVLGCLPNDVYGSDHLALGAVFELRANRCML